MGVINNETQMLKKTDFWLQMVKLFIYDDTAEKYMLMIYLNALCSLEHLQRLPGPGSCVSYLRLVDLQVLFVIGICQSGQSG